MRIGEVASRSGVSARMLRHYESLGLVRPTGRSGGGYREYSTEDIRRIFHIESLRSLGLSLREVGRALDDPAFVPAALVRDLIDRTRERIAAETELLTRLDRIGAVEPAGWEDVLQVVALLHALGSERVERRQQAALTADLPVEALAEAALSESDPHVAGALRWALAQAGDDGSHLLAEGLDSPDPEVRLRAIRSLVEMPGEPATALLGKALEHTDPVVRRHAALHSRNMPDAVPILVEMIVDGVNDVDAADALAALAGDPETADRIAARLVSRLAGEAKEATEATEAREAGEAGEARDAGEAKEATEAREAREAGEAGEAREAREAGETGGAGQPARRRLTQALADIPGEIAENALTALVNDDDRAVAVTATYVLTRRSGGPSNGTGSTGGGARPRR